MSISGWLKNSARLKRWLFFILLGIMIICYSMAQLMKVEVIDFKEILFIILEFMAGILIIIYGIISIQKRTLEIFIEANGVSTKKLKKHNITMDSLIFDKNIYENGPKVVVIGGGSGVNSLVKGLKNYTNNITVVVTLEDNIQNINGIINTSIPKYNDIHLNIAALSNDEELMKKTLQHKFTSKFLEGHNAGDIYLLSMQELFGNISTAIKKATEVLNIKGEIVPATIDDITICAELTDGTIIKNKENIPNEVMTRLEAVKRVFLEPSNVRPTPRVLEAIEDADIIVVAPGSLYTEIIPNLLVKNIINAIKNSKAKKVYVANIMTDEGQTDGYTLSDHLLAINEHVGENIFDFCIADTGEIVPEYVRMYHKKGTDILTVDEDEVKKLGIRLLKQDLSKVENGKIRHDSNLIALTLMQIVLAEIKYADDSSKLQVTTLETVLKEHRKQQKQREKQLKRAKRRYNGKEVDSKKIEEEIKKSILESERQKRRKGDSKFKEKYEERIKNITEVDEKTLKEEKKMFKDFFKDKKKLTEKVEKKQKQKELDDIYLDYFSYEDTNTEKSTKKVDKKNNDMVEEYDSNFKKLLEKKHKILKEKDNEIKLENMENLQKVQENSTIDNTSDVKFSTQKIRTIRVQEGYSQIDKLKERKERQLDIEKEKKAEKDNEIKNERKAEVSLEKEEGKKARIKIEAKPKTKIEVKIEPEIEIEEKDVKPESIKEVVKEVPKENKTKATKKIDTEMKMEVKDEIEEIEEVKAKPKRKTKKQKEKELAEELLQELKKLEEVREQKRKTKAKTKDKE